MYAVRLANSTNLEDVLDLVVKYKHDGTSGTAQNVGECTLEERGSALSLGDRHPAVDRVLIDDLGLLAAGLHHHAPTDRVERIRHDTREGRDGLENNRIKHKKNKNKTR